VSSLGQFSDDLVSAAVVVFVLALVAFAAEWAFGSSGGISRRDATDTAGADDSTAAGASDDDRLTADVAGPVDGRTEVAVGGPGATAVLDRRATVTARAGGVVSTGGPDDGGPVTAGPGAAGPVEAAGEGRRAATAGSIAWMLQVLAVLLLGVGVVTRGIAAERVPWGNLYEFAITGSFAVTAVFAILRSRLGLQFLDVWIAGFAATCAGSAVLLFHEAVGPLRPQLRSYWLVIHVSAAVIATGVFTVGAVLAALYLFRARREAAGRVSSGYVTRLPAAVALDRMSYRVHSFAFPIYTLALIFGAVWAKAAYGRYWEWDPKETWMLISWVLYASYLHARATVGWKGKVAAVIALVAFATVLFNLLGVNFLIAGKHSYAA